MASALRSTMLRGAGAAMPLARAGPTSALAPQMVKALQRNSFGGARVAAFHATSRQQILPPQPQRVEGTANQAVEVPHSSPSHGSYHWSFERLVSIGLIPVTIAPFAAGVAYPLVDATLCVLLVLHSHIGFQALVTDYLPNKRMPTIRRLFDYGVYLASAVVGLGLYEFETNDVGITEAVAKIWTA